MGQIQKFARIFQLVFLCFWVSDFLVFTSADLPYPLCSNITNLESNSQFQNNLQTLFLSLLSNASVSKMYSSSIGNGSDNLYTQYMCLKYVSNHTCSKCIRTAVEDITQLCPNNTEAVVWLEFCQLRYSNRSFLGHLDVSGNLVYNNKKNISNPEQFRSVVNETVRNLIKKAAFNSSFNMYATGKAAFSDIDTVYALVQCTTDLSAEDCNSCLLIALENVTDSCYFSRGARVLSQSCYLRYELYGFYEGQVDPLAPAENQDTGRGNNEKRLITVILSTLSAILIIAVFSSVIYFLSMKKGIQKWKNEIIGRESGLYSIGDSSKSVFQIVDKSLSARESGFMDLAEILAATNNFSELNKLGEGGFGPVYKGKLSDGSEVAVKRLSSFSDQGIEEFTNEVLLIIKLQHKNLVRLLGFYVDAQEKLLVYEFMPNSSLDLILFDQRKRAQLDWGRRTAIIDGIARAILYLHEDSRLRIIHRDLKASNILLDNDMNPKISDFGMARIFASNEGAANTARIVGTYGYMAPEYAMEGLYSIKSDVFSFGILLLEIITGRKKTSFQESKNAPNLTAYAWDLWNRGNELELMDPSLASSCCVKEFSRYLNIGLLCIQEDANDRPTMSNVVLMLKSETVNLQQPERPAFCMGRRSTAQFPNDCSSSLTITLSPR